MKIAVKTKGLSWPSAKVEMELWFVTPEWKGATVVIIGGGPSLTERQVRSVERRAKSEERGAKGEERKIRVIAVNDAYRLAPWADILYACEARWWFWHKGVLGFKGVKAALGWDAVKGRPYPQYPLRYYDGQLVQHINSAKEIYARVGIKIAQGNENGGMKYLAATGKAGLESRQSAIRTGRNGGYQAINLAVHLGAKRIILLGFDMKPDKKGRDHWFGEHPNKVPLNYDLMVRLFDTLVEPLAARGVEVINCTPGSAIKAFPKVGLRKALSIEQ